MSHRHVFPLIAAAACWGLGAVASKHAVAELSPAALLVVQLVSSLAFLCVVRRLGAPPAGNAPPRRLVALGVLNPGVAYLLSLAGLATITAGLSVLLWALEPVIIVALAWALLRDRISVSAALLMALAVGGAAVAGAAGVGGADVVGVTLTIAAVACCAVYTVASSSWFATESNLAVVIGQQWFALGFAVVVFVLSVVLGPGLDLTEVGPTSWVSAIGSGVVYYGLAFWAYVAGLRQTTPGTAAVFLNLIPLFGIVGGALFLSERLTSVQLVGAGTVVVAVIGLTLTTTPARR